MLVIVLIILLVLLLAGGANFPDARMALWVLAIIVAVILLVNHFG